jgi:transcription elongation GreA/GreB family factor
MKEKEILYNYCSEYIQQRIQRIQEEINRAQSAANEESKSSMGDKYETSRAMAQLEVERNLIQLREAEKINMVLQGIFNVKPKDIVIPGSLVTTTHGVFYVSISIGAINLAGQDYFIVSADSPIGRLLSAKKVGDSLQWQGKETKIQKIE